MSTQPRLAAPEHVDPLLGTTPGRSYESIVRELQEAQHEIEYLRALADAQSAARRVLHELAIEERDTARAEVARLEREVQAARELAGRSGDVIGELSAQLDWIAIYRAERAARNAPIGEMTEADHFVIEAALYWGFGVAHDDAALYIADDAAILAFVRAIEAHPRKQGAVAPGVLIKPEQCCGGHADCAHVRQCRGETA